MIVHIIREACCSQDDQLGPLEIQLECDENSTLEQVINEICRVKFLQYSSSHNHMIGRIDDQKIVEILLLKEEIIFHIYKDSLVRNLITESGLRFSFINNIFETKEKTMTENRSDQHLVKRSFLKKLLFWK
ncbi:hypothetical protein ABFY41_04950 [Acinetobacter haemolyticus]|uniref:hypothetical protein n=1 Tax=Acinetobacter haemolyticus TaxID=29430 RepID=UPI002A6A621D|nr:hypothetical protein [Acinetobacter haemolyticus]WPO67447.1 hypothetical protein SDC64_00420 [Acinetobacter haemolyticus]